jgi:hypothetical protein
LFRQFGQAKSEPDAAALALKHSWQTWILQHGLATSVDEAQTMQPGIVLVGSVLCVLADAQQRF